MKKLLTLTLLALSIAFLWGTAYANPFLVLGDNDNFPKVCHRAEAATFDADFEISDYGEFRFTRVSHLRINPVFFEAVMKNIGVSFTAQLNEGWGYELNCHVHEIDKQSKYHD